MSSVVLCIDGPLQSWGSTAGFTAERPTDMMPTLSGIVGLISNALGRSRNDTVDDLAAANLTVRTDRPGRRIRDFHTVGTDGRYVPSATGKKGTYPIVTERWYLADAAFIAVYTPDPDLGLTTEAVHEALSSPKRPLYLGRRSCPPASPVSLGTSSFDPAHILTQLPILDDPRDDGVVVIEATHDDSGDGEYRTRIDRPVTFSPDKRSYLARQVQVSSHTIPAERYAGRGPTAVRTLIDFLEAMR